jgi:hypothetical protein
VNIGSFRGTKSFLHNHLPLSFEGEGDKGGEVEMTQGVEIIKSNLKEYPSTKYYLGEIIDQRLKIECYEYGMITAQLLDGEPSKSDLTRLEGVLQFGKAHCTDFKLIFQERKLPNKDRAIDNEIINILAEVKAFEFLHKHGFRDITKIKREKDVKTVDFTAKRNSQNYAVEVTRLGLARSDRKKPKLDKLSKPPWLTIIDSKEPQNRMRIAEDIYDEVIDKYPQVKEFCQRQVGVWKGILFISNGRDYFVVGRYENKLYELQPSTVHEILKQEWKLLKEGQEYECLHHILITMGKDLGKAIIYPEL